MDLVMLEKFLMMSTLINYGVLLLWSLLFIFAKDWMRSFHGKWFTLSPERFDMAHYLLIGGYKLIIIAFFLIPWIVVACLT